MSRPPASALSISTDLPFVGYMLRVCVEIPSACAKHTIYGSLDMFVAGPHMFSEVDADIMGMSE